MTEFGGVTAEERGLCCCWHSLAGRVLGFSWGTWQGPEIKVTRASHYPQPSLHGAASSATGAMLSVVQTMTLIILRGSQESGLCLFPY